MNARGPLKADDKELIAGFDELIGNMREQSGAGNAGWRQINGWIDRLAALVEMVTRQPQEPGGAERYLCEMWNEVPLEIKAHVMSKGYSLDPVIATLRHLEAASVSHQQEAPKEENRCAVCGWPLSDFVETGCVRGNCSMRPLPARLYDRERAIAEYGDHAPAKWQAAADSRQQEQPDRDRSSHLRRLV